jgi:hypothetical protein
LPSLTQADEEAASRAKGHAIREARDARANGLIQKVECSLQSNFEYTLRRVDHCHPHRPTDFTRGENQSMIHRDEYPYDWT